MDELDFDTLKSIGINIDEALYRFSNNRAMLEKYLRKFATDPMYVRLHEAIKVNDIEEIKDTTHALKGTAGNLSITSLYDLFNRMMTLLRDDQTEEALALMPTVDQEYQRISEYLK